MLSYLSVCCHAWQSSPLFASICYYITIPLISHSILSYFSTPNTSFLQRDEDKGKVSPTACTKSVSERLEEEVFNKKSNLSNDVYFMSPSGFSNLLMFYCPPSSNEMLWSNWVLYLIAYKQTYKSSWRDECNSFDKLAH